MRETAQTIGVAVSLWRYPIKSLLGEELNATAIVGGSLLGDRSYALVDTETGKVDYGHSLLVFVSWFMAAFVLLAIAGCAILGISRLFLRSSK